MKVWIARNTLWLVALCGVAMLVLEEAADARIGGGQGYGRSGGGRSSSGGGGGGGGEAEILFLILRLCIEYPAIGIPLLIVFVGFMIARYLFDNMGSRRVNRTHGAATTRVVARRPRRTGLEHLRDRDKAFSLPVLYDYMILVHRRAYAAMGTKNWGPLEPFVSTAAIEDIKRENRGVKSVSEIVVGSVSLTRIQPKKSLTLLTIQFESTRVEQTAKGERRALVHETWTFRRAADAQSLSPEDVMRMGCPSCGAAVESTTMGACQNCDTPITTGQLQWQALSVDVKRRRPVKAPEVGFVQGGDEGSVHLGTVVAADLSAQQRNLLGRHPDFEMDVFEGRVRTIYYQLQEAWSAGRYNDIRPHVTDTMYQTLRFWIEKYTTAKLRNQLDDVKLLKVAVVRIDVDAWYESITVRIWGEMKDYVVDESGKVVGGNAKTARRFSEYWTLLRAAGSPDGTSDGIHCPSCGAPLDNVSAAGICGYCDTKITTGQFDWVLSRIEQCEAYKGG